MRTGRPKADLVLTANQREELERISKSRSLAHGLVQRAKMILLSSQGISNVEVARQVGVSNATVGTWRRRFIHQGVAGLYDEPKPGRPRTIDDDQVALVVKKTLSSKPKGGTHWSCRSMAKETGLSKNTINRIWQAFSLKPHQQKHFTLSTDPFFVDKVRDIVGLYLNPPDKALVLCVDEKTQIQALDRTQPILPLDLGYLEGITHHYVRNGTTTLFAALDVATGKVITQCKKRHRHQEFLQFLRHIDANVPPDLEIHLVVDNYATHKSPKVRNWLAKRPRYQVHYTPTYSSWLNQVEIWFGIITKKAIRRGTFSSVKDLTNKIDKFVSEYNAKAKPFTWYATADSILNKVKRLCKAISGTQH